jgi:MFS family permease
MLDRNALAILFLTLFLVMLGVGIIIPNIAYRAVELDATSIEISLLFTLYSLMQFLFAPLWGHLSDRIGRKPVLLMGLFGGGAGLLLFGVAAHLPLLYAARAISGLMSSAALPTAMAYVADVTDDAGAARHVGVDGGAIGLGFHLRPRIGGWLARFDTTRRSSWPGPQPGDRVAAAILLRESLPPGAGTPAAPWFAADTGRVAGARWRCGTASSSPCSFAMAALEDHLPAPPRDRFRPGGARDGNDVPVHGNRGLRRAGLLPGAADQRARGGTGAAGRADRNALGSSWCRWRAGLPR